MLSSQFLEGKERTCCNSHISLILAGETGETGPAREGGLWGFLEEVDMHRPWGLASPKDWPQPTAPTS